MRFYFIQKIFVGFFVSFIISCSSKKDTGINLSPWKFKTGDHLEWANPDFDDSAWDTIRIDHTWDEYGYSDYDGYAWYRTSFVLPASLKDESAYQRDLIIELGKVDDIDQTYLNGTLIGQNGESLDLSDTAGLRFEPIPYGWTKIRVYKLKADDEKIKWDQENVIAVRVWDRGGLGGIYDAHPVIRMKGLKDYVRLDINSGSFSIQNRRNFEKTIRLENTSVDYKFEGILRVSVKDKLTNDEIFKEKFKIKLEPGSDREQLISFQTEPGRNCLIEYSYTEVNSGEKILSAQSVPYILTPPVPDEPRINGPVVYGVRPGHPFLYKIPVSGEKPVLYSAIGLPAGLKLNSETGIITGRTHKSGNYKVLLKVRNQSGTAEKEFTIKVGKKITLTPPMGWNSWNCWGLSVSDEKIRNSANEMIRSGLADHGFSYINIDDGWENPDRLPDGTITGNEKFPDFPALSEYVHSLGLKLGIFSSPGPLTCGGYLGSYRHEYKDVKTWSKWGIDYLKYDWCSYGEIAKNRGLPDLKKPYFLMRNVLDKVGRDIIYSLCQYGMGNVWEWGNEVGAELWRTTGDITDTWSSLRGIGFRQSPMAPFAGPGNWNDPDMLVLGWVGWSKNLHPTRLTPDEQYTHISLWALLSAPLLLGNDMAKLDNFTLSLLTNDEVLAVNQDPLGKQANRVFDENEIQYWLKEMSDGSVALGIFNLNDGVENIYLNLTDLNLNGTFVFRDLWRQNDLGQFNEGMDVTLPGHGVLLLKISEVK
jgi:hypothetical protein